MRSRQTLSLWRKNCESHVSSHEKLKASVLHWNYDVVWWQGIKKLTKADSNISCHEKLKASVLHQFLCNLAKTVSQMLAVTRNWRLQFQIFKLKFSCNLMAVYKETLQQLKQIISSCKKLKALVLNWKFYAIWWQGIKKPCKNWVKYKLSWENWRLQFCVEKFYAI